MLRKALTAVFWLVAASCALAQGVPGLAIPPGLIGGFTPPLVGTWNPSDKGASTTLSNGNLTMATPNSASWGVRSTTSEAAGKWFAEFTFTTPGDGAVGVGLGSISVNNYPGHVAGSGGLTGAGSVIVNNVLVGNAVLGTLSPGDVIGMKLDADADTIAFNRNGGAYTTAYALTSTSSAWFLMAGNFVAATSATLNKNPVYPIPAGFVVWGN